MNGYSISDFREHLGAKGDTAFELFARNGMSFQLYHLNIDTCVQIMHNDENFDSKIYAIIMLDGQADALLPDQRIVLEPGHILSHETSNPMYIRSRTKCNFIIATNEEDQKIEDMSEFMQMVINLEIKDRYLCGHNSRVGNYSSMLMQRYQPDHTASDLYIAALLHDIGKIYIDEEILNKPDRLSDAEFEQIKLHPVHSYEMITESLGRENVAKIARWHHEKLDGSGYPDHLVGDAIPVESRVISVADIFDALTTSRSYRKRFTFAEALEIMQKDADSGKIDKEIFETLKQLISEGYIIEGHDDRIQDDKTW